MTATPPVRGPPTTKWNEPIMAPPGRSDSHIPVYTNAIDNHSHLESNIVAGKKARDFMYVCICNAITDRQIRDAVETGVDDLWGLQASLGVATNCRSCAESAEEILRDARDSRARAEPRTYIPAPA